MQFFRFHRSGLTLAAVSLTTYSLFAQEAIPPSAEPTYVLDAGKQHELRVYPFAIAGKWGLIDEAGKTLIRAQFDSIGTFQQHYGEPYATFFHRGKAGILHRSGKLILPAAEYDDIEHDGYLYDPGITRKGKKYGLVRVVKPGKPEQVLAPEYDEMVPYRENGKHYIVRKNNVFGVMSSGGVWEVPLEYDSARIAEGSGFASAVRLVKGNRKYMYTETGRLQEVTGLSDEAASKQLEDATRYSGGGEVMVGYPLVSEDSTQERVQPDLHIETLHPGSYRVKFTTVTDNAQVRRGTWESKSYRKLERFGYHAVGAGGAFRLRAQATNGKWGILDETGRVILPVVYDQIKANFDLEEKEAVFITWSYALTRQGKLWGAISERCEVLLPNRYLRVADAGTGSLFCVDAAGRKAYWANGKVHLPK